MFRLLILCGVFITSVIILLVLSTLLSSGVTCLFHEKLILWSSLSKVISPLSSLLTFIDLSFLVNLNEQGLHLHFMPLGFISISFLNCSFPQHNGQSKVINLLVYFCSLFKLTVAGSSSDSSKSSGIGFFNLLTFFGGIIEYN